MERLYAPWRESYATRVDGEKKEHIPHDACVFCLQLEDSNDEKYFILRRFPNTIVMLNLYPYNGGHLLVLPFKHADSLAQLSPAIRSEIMEVINLSITILSEELEAQGFNVGLNLARAAGAGIPSHVHFHVLPRWIGDTNFLVTLADTKQISVDLYALYTKLRPYFQDLKIS